MRYSACVRSSINWRAGDTSNCRILSRGYVRASIGAFNTAEDIETFVRAVAEIARNG